MFKRLLLGMIVVSISAFSATYAQKTIKSPKNIIIMIGDGMGPSQVVAGTYYQYGKSDAQKFQSFPTKIHMATYPAKAGKNGEDAGLDWSHGYNTSDAWESFDWIKSQYTCSAASGTALSTGEKTYNGGLGVDLNKKPLKNISQVAKELKKSAGVVTSVQLSHATPASFVAHNVHRDNYSQIAREMILDSKMDVIMGGGHPYYDHSGKKLSSARTFKYVGDSLIWNQLGKNAAEFKLADGLFKVQDVDGDNIPDPWTLIESKQDFEKLVSSKPPKRLLGVARVAETLQQRRHTNDDKSYFEGKGIGGEDAYVVPFNTEVPDLKTMSLGALNVLSQNQNGFFLMVEGGAIDWACHGNQKGRLIEEFIDFSIAIDAVVEWVEKNSSWDETLLIVTADHETGYLTGIDNDKTKPFAKPIANKGKGQMPEMQFNATSHTNSLVEVFAIGAGSDIFHFYTDETDQRYGKYIHNSELGAAMKLLWTGIK